MPRLKALSGENLIKIFFSFGFAATSQKGSHIKLRRKIQGINQTLTIPNHNELDAGTLHAIFHQALRYIPETEFRQHFYTD